MERGGIPLAHVLSPHRRQLRRWLGVRRSLVEARANLVTTLRGLAREQGLRFPSCPSENFAKNFRNGKHPAELSALLEAGLETLEVITAELDGVERKLVELCAGEPISQLLTTAPGVGLTVASAFVSVIDDARRFRSAHEVESYLGLVPSEDTTGGRRRLGAINKHGNPYVRALLVQAAWSLWRTAGASDPLRLWTDAIAERRGRRIAVIGLARRIAGVLWALWRDGTVYDPTHLACSQAGGVRRAVQTLECQAGALERASRKRAFNRRTRSSPPEVTPA